MGDSNLIPTKDDNEQYNSHTVYDELTIYAGIEADDMPAIAMDIRDHRNPKGEIGAATSTGNSEEAKQYRESLNHKLKEGKYWEALRDDCQDTLNTTAGMYPNYYKESIFEMITYLKDNEIPGATTVLGIPEGRLINDHQYHQIIFDLKLEHLLNPIGHINDSYYNE